MADNQNKTSATPPENTKSAGEAANLKKSAANTPDKSNQQSAGQAVKETAGKAVGQAKEKATNILDEQKSKAASSLSGVADGIRKVGENLREGEKQNVIADTAARYGDDLAAKIEDFSGYLDQATFKDLTRDIEGFARRQPAIFVGGAFLLGVLAARFLKTSAPHQNSPRRPRSNFSNHKTGDARSTTDSQSV